MINMKNNIGKITVMKSVKPLPIEDRQIPNLILGRIYFVSFGNNNVYPCLLKGIIKEGNRTSVSIEIPGKIQHKNGFIDSSGITSHNWNTSHSLYSNEIGWTPKHAVENTVTS